MLFSFFTVNKEAKTQNLECPIKKTMVHGLWTMDYGPIKNTECPMSMEQKLWSIVHGLWTQKAQKKRPM